MSTRRRFLQGSLATAVATSIGVLAYTFEVEPEWLQVVRRPLPIEGLPSGLEGRSLVQLSDLHVGKRVSDDYILRTFETVRHLNPDLIVYTGDFTSYEPSGVEHAEFIYSQAPRGRMATIGILGNHDYGPNWAHPEIAARLVDVLHDHGIRILRNQVVQVEGLQIAGMDDLWAERFDPKSAVAQLLPSRASLALSHNPDTVDLEGWGGYRGWILSGHTHGGQCKAPFLPPPILPVKNRRYTAGEFDVGDGRRIYISRGVGHLKKVRFNVRPEVTRFALRRA